ncbi:MAG: hypothetical protein MRY78_10925 [Saprospiraceae bacterium]|nr:hypothetical protein [Saprospiraceae bacterium]
MTKRLLLFGLCQIMLLSSAFANRYFVNQNTNCTADCNGLSWSTAFAELQTALQLAAFGDEIWVAEGRYTPHANDRNVYFQIQDGITLFGGFAGTETTLDERDHFAHLTILSGDLLGNDGPAYANYWDNSYTIIYTDGVSENTLVDGFIIQGGNADNESGSILQRAGAGWFNKHYQGTGSPIIRNCTFESNKTTGGGGAFYNTGFQGESHPVFEHCSFKNNQANTGGAVYCEANTNQSGTTFVACLFENNEAFYTGGVIYNFAKSGNTASTFFGSCVFTGNTADNAGAIYCLGDEGIVEAEILNCTFYGNYADVGGVIYLNESWNGSVNAHVENSIIWNSTGSFDPHFHFSGNGQAQLSLSYTLIDTPDCETLGHDEHINCSDLLFNTDPLFEEAENHNFHLQSNSSAIDAGNSIATSGSLSEDFDGLLRQQGDIVDMGAFEFPVPDPIDLELTLSTNNTAPFIGSAIVLTLELNNQGPGEATEIFTRLSLPDGYSLLSTATDFDPLTSVWYTPALLPNNQASIELIVEVLPQGNYQITAEVTAAAQNDIDSTPDNQAAEDDLAILQITPQQPLYPIGEHFDPLETGIPELDGISTKVANQQIRFGPNPVRNFIQVQAAPAYAKYYIINQQGQVLDTGILGQSRVETDQLHPGQYWLLIEGQSCWRFIKM